ncbi:MAG: TonB family protein [Sphingomicrobium sp.]
MKSLLVIALLSAATSAIAAETPVDRAAREALNAEVLHRYYPAAAIAAGAQGPVRFIVSLDRDGVPTECGVTASSGHASLDTATCDLILLHARFQPNHNETGGKTAMSHKGVINWILPGAPRQAPTATVIATRIDPLDRRKCKRALKAGSMIVYERICMTVREWETDNAEQRDFWQEQQGKKGFTGG